MLEYATGEAKGTAEVQKEQRDRRRDILRAEPMSIAPF